MLLALYIILGLIFGSFYNAVINRSPRAQSLLKPASYCPICRAPLEAYDLVPIFSYIFLRGRCRFCRVRISLRYPVVELLTASAFTCAYLICGTSILMLSGCIFLSLLIITAFTDLETGLIPDIVTYPGMIIGFLLSFWTLGWQSSLAGALAFGGMLFLGGFFSGGGMGGGDVKLGALIGAFMGLKMGLIAFLISALLGGAWALYLVMLGRADLQTSIRFGPFLALAGAATWMFGQRLMYFYFVLSGI